jgi:hypothetical protein
MAGYAQHSARHTTPCTPCLRARTDYLDEMLAVWAPDGTNHARRNTREFVEDYLYLVSTGETHGETIAARLGTNQPAMERRLHKHGIHILHTNRAANGRPTGSAQHKRLAVAA